MNDNDGRWGEKVPGTGYVKATWDDKTIHGSDNNSTTNTNLLAKGETPEEKLVLAQLYAEVKKANFFKAAENAMTVVNAAALFSLIPTVAVVWVAAVRYVFGL